MRAMVDLESRLAEQRAPTRLLAQITEARDRRRGRPRDPVEAALLERSAVAAVARRRSEGRLVRLGPRRYELR